MWLPKARCHQVGDKKSQKDVPEIFLIDIDIGNIDRYVRTHTHTHLPMSKFPNSYTFHVKGTIQSIIWGVHSAPSTSLPPVSTRRAWIYCLWAQHASAAPLCLDVLFSVCSFTQNASAFCVL